MHHHRLGHWQCEGLHRGARTDRRTDLESVWFAPMTETRSIDGGSVDFWSLSKAKVFRFPFCSALAHFPLSLALTGSPACLSACPIIGFVISVTLHQHRSWRIWQSAERLVFPFWYCPRQRGFVLSRFWTVVRRYGLSSSFLPRTERAGKGKGICGWKGGLVRPDMPANTVKKGGEDGY